MDTIRSLPATERVLRARSALILTEPFFACIALAQKIVETTRVATMAVDGTHLFVNPEYVSALTEARVTGMVVHEVLHIALKHHTRRGSRDPLLWNKACDYAINPRVLAAGYELWEGALLDSKFDGMAAEEIHAVLYNEENPRQQPEEAKDEQDEQDEQEQGEEPGEDNSSQEPAEGQEDGNEQDGSDQGDAGSEEGDEEAGEGVGAGGTQSDDGDDRKDGGEALGGEASGAGEGQGEDAAEGDEPIDAPDPGGCGGVIDAAPDAAGLEEADAQAEKLVRQAFNAAARAAGDAPGHAKRVVEELDRSRVDWREIVSRFVSDSVVKMTDWTAPSRRFSGSDYFMPAMKADGVATLVVAVDTSASVTDVVLKVFGAEMQGVLDSGVVDRMEVIYADTEVRGTAAFERGDTVNLDGPGGGGTSFAPTMRHVRENHQDAAALVYLTDLDCSQWGEEPPLPVLWAVYGRARHAPWGEVLPIDPHS